MSNGMILYLMGIIYLIALEAEEQSSDLSDTEGDSDDDVGSDASDAETETSTDTSDAAGDSDESESEMLTGPAQSTSKLIPKQRRLPRQSATVNAHAQVRQPVRQSNAHARPRVQRQTPVASTSSQQPVQQISAFSRSRDHRNPPMISKSTRPQPAIVQNPKTNTGAVTGTDPSRARKSLSKLCQAVPAANHIAVRELAVNEVDLTDLQIKKEDSNTSEGYSGDMLTRQKAAKRGHELCTREADKENSRLRKTRAAFERCLRCGKQCAVIFNDAMSCKWHPGRKVLNKDAEIWHYRKFSVRDPNYFESLKDDDQYASGFKWSCCNASVENGSLGCIAGEHLLTITTYASVPPDKEVLSKKRAAPDGLYSRNVRRCI